ncbi:iron complex transport system substrate-binding protein [Mesorhizobium sp. J18]|uniref:ABC transporter substrate-binding protein n=1 Tax=Mesorhizobium sp. J18 TaxID=935263 RepID=UPI00119BEEB2|nr:ABC transporter substrate-binding protein [Mesorhizobium sp. J18]TWG97294.1 iron complex transport system substrate-binding protein [Mesorhizobium sp. J18]
MIRILLFILLLSAAFAGPASAKVLDISGATPYPALYRPDDAGPPPDGPGLVLLGADLVEIAVALGAADHILARPADIDLPGIENTPHQVREWAGVEGVLALRPQIVVGSSVINRRLLDGLSAVGIQTDLIDRTLPATEKVARLSALLGLEERGVELIEAIEADYAEVRPVEIDGRKLRIVHASKMGAGTNFTAGGAETAVHNLILRVGALNAFAEIGRDRYRPVTPEGMVLMAPDVVLIAESELPAFGNLDGLWEDYPGIGLTPAGRARNIIIMRDLHVRADAASSGIAAKTLSQALHEMFE